MLICKNYTLIDCQTTQTLHVYHFHLCSGFWRCKVREKDGKNKKEEEKRRRGARNEDERSEDKRKYREGRGGRTGGVN